MKASCEVEEEGRESDVCVRADDFDRHFGFRVADGTSRWFWGVRPQGWFFLRHKVRKSRKIQSAKDKK